MPATLDRPVADPQRPAPPGLRPGPLVAATAAGGVVAELLVHNNVVNGAPLGAGFAVAGVLGAAGLLAGKALLGRAPSRPAALLAVLSGLFAALLAWRASPELAAANALATVTLLLGAGYLYREGRLADVTLSEYPMAGLRTVVGVVAGPPQLAAAISRRPRWGDLATAARPVVRGLALAAVPLLVFAALFASADAVFASWLGRPFRLAVPWRGGFWGVALAGALAWSGLGLMWYAATHDDRPEPEPDRRPPLLGAVEAAVALAAVVTLFAAFVVVQFAHLFGGDATVADTGGLTYAEYARRGFFELLAVAALVTAAVLAVDWGATPARRSRVIDGLQYALVGLTGVVLASAVVRLDAYAGEFGLTKLRLYAFAALVWVAFLLAWLALTVLRGRRRWFPVGASVAALTVLAALNVANPDALIAGVNVDRAVEGARALDVAYAAWSLSDDALPVLVERAGELDQCTRLRLEASLLLAAEGRPGGWRSYNLARARAERLLGETPEFVDLPAC